MKKTSMIQYKPMRLLPTILFAVVMLHGCGSQPGKPSRTSTGHEAEINQLIEAGNFLHAAERYLQLAELYPKKSTLYQLKAAEAYLNAGEMETAVAIVKNARPKPKQATEIALKKILLARFALDDNAPDIALDTLKSPPETGSARELFIAYYQIRYQAHGMLGNWYAAVQERLLLGQYLADENDRLENIKLTWNALNRIDKATLKQLRTSSPAEMTGWIELALINKTMLLKPKLLEQALNSWSEYYPGHPAIPAITQYMLSLSKSYYIKPGHIALCLPLSGQLQKASEAIRDGFLSAWFAGAADKPIVTIYDADSLNIMDKYKEAVENGADFVVGPLEKRAISSLLVTDILKVTTLALNQVENGDPELIDSPQALALPKLIQFGLSPEDEARQVAEQALFDGHNRALVITPDNEWGTRLFNAFNDEWNSLGGKILERISYQPQTKDYKTPVKQLLNINSSIHRINLLQQKLGRQLGNERRIRGDANMIFMAATPAAARQIVPQFRFFRAANIPIYSTSHVYTGNVNPEQDADMNGVIFTDLPWVIDPKTEGSRLQQSINRNWQADKSGFRRLYALGIDAYMLISHLGGLAHDKTSSYAGQTGELSMDNRGLILRKLLWAKFIKGRPQILEPADMH